MTTEKNIKPTTCEFPYCPSRLDGYMAKERFCVVHSRSEYQRLLTDIKQLEQANATLAAGVEDRVIKSPTKRPFLLWERTWVYPAYETEDHEDAEKYGARYLREKGKSARLVSLGDEPDLFIRFAELPETESAYLSFASSHGLLGLHKDWQKRGLVTDWPEHTEPLVLIGEFHKNFRAAYDCAKKLVRRENLGDYDRRRLKKWFDWHLHIHTQPTLLDFSGQIALKAQGLAGVMTLQLYRFLATRQTLKICDLPRCNLQTSRKRFCSTKHQKLFNTWKLRGTIVQVDGAWEKAENPVKKPARTKPGAGKIQRESD